MPGTFTHVKLSGQVSSDGSLITQEHGVLAGRGFTSMEEAETLIKQAPGLAACLYELTEIYWGVTHDRNGDGGPVPSCITKARRLLVTVLPQVREATLVQELADEVDQLVEQLGEQAAELDLDRLHELMTQARSKR